MAVRLADLTWPDVAHRSMGETVLAIPVGATEQHGHHLPLSTDTDVAIALCERLAALRDDILVAPPVAYGSSGEHTGFPGTLSIGQAALELLLVELVRSATETFRHVVLVCGHGGNAEPAQRAVKVLQAESRDVLLYLPRWEGDAHAGHTETSLRLAIDPCSVHMDRAVPGVTTQLAQLLPALRDRGVRAVSPSGVLGDPRLADAAHGAAVLAGLTAELVDGVARWLEPVSG
jgi:creatinine amidohydrolase